MKIENIKFRGKSKKTVEWLYGDLIRNVEGAFAIVPPYEISMNNYYRNYVVDKETIGQYTGLKDKYGREIYEGDILYYRDAKIKTPVTYRNGGFYFSHYGGTTFSAIADHEINKYTVVGNIYDNKELLTQEYERFD